MIVRPFVSTPLIGREQELAALVDLRRAAARGRGSFVLVRGEAGIGKSRLVAAFTETISNGRAALGTGVCCEFGSMPYGPIAEALSELGADVQVGAATSRPDLFFVLRRQIESIAARRNTVVVLEDLQWADEGTLRFLLFLLPSVAASRLLVVATYRNDDLFDDREFGGYITRLARNRTTHQISLMPLSAAQLRRLVRLAAARPGRQIGKDEIDEIVERAEGNPFFAEELLRSAMERESETAQSRDMPESVRAAVGERLHGLDPDARSVALLAAVLGRRFEAELLAEIAERPLPAVLGILRRMRDLNLVAEAGVELRRTTYSFRHALTREAIYAGMLIGEVRPLHARILDTLETRADAVPYDLGYHAWAALEEPRCLIYNERAGDDAIAMHAYADAARCYERALHGAVGDVETARLLRKAAASWARDGQARRAMRRYEAAAHALERAGRMSELAEAYQAMSSQARLAGDNERAMKILHEALAVARGERSDVRATLSCALAFLHLDRGESDAAAELIGDREVAAVPAYESVRNYAAMVRGDVAALRDASARNVEKSAALGPEHELQARFNTAFALCVLGFDDEAGPQFDALLPALREHRLTSLEVLACANAALMHVRGGRLAAARALIERALANPEPTTTGPIALAAAALDVAGVSGDDDLLERALAEELIETAFESRINSALGRFAGPYARWLDRRGDSKGARAVLRRAMEGVRAPFGATETIVAAAELGDDATRTDALAFLPPIAAMRHVPIYAATEAHLSALEAIRSGEHRAARASAAEAVKCYRTMGWVFHEARCCELLGDRESAAAIYRKFGASGELRHLETQRPKPAMVDRPSTALSRREREIAALVACGTSNRRLAQRLDVSQRTVEKHLTSIYDKLGLHNRSELAAFVARNEREAERS